MRNKIPYFKPAESKNDLDIIGAVISSIALVLLVLGILTLIKDVNAGICEIILGLIIMAIFICYELKRKRSGKVPLLDVDLFKDKNLRIGVSIKLLYYVNSNMSLVKKNYKLHDPDSPLLIGEVNDEVIKEVREPSFIGGQQKLI